MGKVERMELLDDDEFYMDEIPKKDKKKKKKNTEKLKEPGSSSIKQLLAGFNERQTKNNVQNTLLKLIADIAGVGLGTALSATMGKVAPAAAIALMGAGHYMGDESGLLRMVGASTLAHSVAKSKEYRKNPEMTIGERLKEVKDGWLYAALLKRYEEEQQTQKIEPQTVMSKVVEVSPESIVENESVQGVEWEDDELDYPGLNDEVEEQSNRYERPKAPINQSVNNGWENEFPNYVNTQENWNSDNWREPFQDDTGTDYEERQLMSDKRIRQLLADDELPDMSLF